MVTWVLAQEAPPKVPHVAVLPFVGDKTVSPEQLAFITGKFSGELIATNAFTVIDRNKMNFILQEQGFQTSGACSDSECKVQMGQLLGVDYLVTGNMVKFGPEYAFRIEYIDVGTGRIVKTVELSKEGELYQVYKAVCVDAAQQLAKAVRGPASTLSAVSASSTQEASSSSAVEVSSSSQAVVLDAPITVEEPTKPVVPEVPSKPLSLKRKIALGMLLPTAIGVGGGAFFNSQAVASAEKYDEEFDALDFEATQSAYYDLQSKQQLRSISYGTAIGAGLIALVLWFWPE